MDLQCPGASADGRGSPMVRDGLGRRVYLFIYSDDCRALGRPSGRLVRVTLEAASRIHLEISRKKKKKKKLGTKSKRSSKSFKSFLKCVLSRCAESQRCALIKSFWVPGAAPGAHGLSSIKFKRRHPAASTRRILPDPPLNSRCAVNR